MGDTTYMSVFGGGTEMATFATDQTSISIYWGSIDPGNGFTAVTINGYTLTGAQLGMMGATDDGNQLSPTSNELVTISGLGAFTTAEFSSQAIRSSSALALMLRDSGAVDLGDDDPWICRARLCRVPPELTGPGARDLILYVSKRFQGAAARRPFLFAKDFQQVQANPAACAAWQLEFQSSRRISQTM